MSRCYEMFVRVSGVAPDKIEAVKNAAEEEWRFDGWYDQNGELTACGQDRLCGGETADEFAQRLAKAVWTANGGGCRVEVHATCQEVPYEAYCFDEDDYRRLRDPVRQGCRELFD